MLRSENGEQLDAGDLMYTDDATYTLTFVTKSSNSALVATTALVKFYRRDGSYVTEKEYSSTGDLTGILSVPSIRKSRTSCRWKK